MPATFTASYQNAQWIDQRRRDERDPRGGRFRCRAACPVPVRCPGRRPERPVQSRGDGRGRPDPSRSQPPRDRQERRRSIPRRPTRPSSSACRRRRSVRPAGRGCNGLSTWSARPSKSASPEGKPSLFIREATKGDTPEFRLIARDGQFVITRPGDERPLVGQIDGLNADGRRAGVARLEHMARWTQTARLNNPASSIQPGDVKLTVLVDGKEVSGGEIRLEYQSVGRQAGRADVSGQHDQQQPAHALLRLARPDPALPGLRRTARTPAASSWSRARRPGAIRASRSTRPFPTRSGSKA